MKKQSSPFAAFGLKAVLLVAFSLYGFAGSPCQAQSITGKWKRTVVKQTVTDKATGNRQDVTQQAQQAVNLVEEMIEFKADHTFNSTTILKGNKKGFTSTGTYTISGNQLEITSDKKNSIVEGKKYVNEDVTYKLPHNLTIQSVNDNTMTWHYIADFTDEGSAFTIDIEEIFQKL